MKAIRTILITTSTWAVFACNQPLPDSTTSDQGENSQIARYECRTYISQLEGRTGPLEAGPLKLATDLFYITKDSMGRASKLNISKEHFKFNYRTREMLPTVPPDFNGSDLENDFEVEVDFKATVKENGRLKSLGIDTTLSVSVPELENKNIQVTTTGAFPPNLLDIVTTTTALNLPGGNENSAIKLQVYCKLEQ